MPELLEAPAREAGPLERLCWQRHENDLALAYPFGHPDSDEAEVWRQASQHPRGLWWNPQAAARPVEFIEHFCKHHKGEWAGQRVELAPWQRDATRILFGWQLADGSRRFRVAYIEVPRKNGKTTWAGGLALYLLVADGEPGGEVYATATKKDQAKIVHGDAVHMVKASPTLRRYVKVLRNNLNCPKLGSKFEPLGADSSTLDGLNPSANIVDELHAHKDRALWDVMDTAMGARRQPLTLAITTAGLTDPEAIGFQQHTHAVAVLEGTLEDDGFFAFIAAAGETDDWTAPETWARANPNLGVSVRPGYLAAQAKKAAEQPSFLPTFLRLHLNVWVAAAKRWLPMERWNAEPTEPIEWHQARELELSGARCFGGLDLSTTRDLSSLCLLFPLPLPAGRAPEYATLFRCYCPEVSIERRSRRDRVPYDAWARLGWLTPTPGEVVDYDFIRADLVALAARYKLVECAFDPWNATQLTTQLAEQDGLKMIQVRQGYQSLSAPSKELEKLVVSGRLHHGGHPIARWAAANVTLRTDPNGNIAPDKAKSTGRIDPIVALIMALSRAVANVAPGSVYEHRGLRIL